MKAGSTITRLMCTTALGFGLSPVAMANIYRFANPKKNVSPWYIVVPADSGLSMVHKGFPEGSMIPDTCAFTGEIIPGLPPAKQKFIIQPGVSALFSLVEHPGTDSGSLPCFRVFDANGDHGGVVFVEQPGESKVRGMSTLTAKPAEGPGGRYVNPKAVEISPMTWSVVFALENWGTFDSLTFDLLEAAGDKVQHSRHAPPRLQLSAFDSVASQIPLATPGGIGFSLQNGSPVTATHLPAKTVATAPSDRDSIGAILDEALAAMDMTRPSRKNSPPKLSPDTFNPDSISAQLNELEAALEASESPAVGDRGLLDVVAGSDLQASSAPAAGRQEADRHQVKPSGAGTGAKPGPKRFTWPTATKPDGEVEW